MRRKGSRCRVLTSSSPLVTHSHKSAKSRPPTRELRWISALHPLYSGCIWYIWQTNAHMFLHIIYCHIAYAQASSITRLQRTCPTRVTKSLSRATLRPLSWAPQDFKYNYLFTMHTWETVNALERRFFLKSFWRINLMEIPTLGNVSTYHLHYLPYW